MADFNGFRGAAKPLDDIDLPRLGYRIGVGEDEIHAVIDVETAGGAWDAKGRPKLLFEPHRFWRNLGPGAKRDRAVKAGLAYPSWGEQPYPKDSYPRLIEAMAIDETAALKSASWGLGQILGENHAMVGYDTVQEMVLASLDDADKHLEMMVAFILSAKLDGKLRAHDWAGFARGYNGPQYAKNGYHTKLEAAFKRWSKIRDTPWSPADEVIRVPVPTPRPDDTPATIGDNGGPPIEPTLPTAPARAPTGGPRAKANGAGLGVLIVSPALALMVRFGWIPADVASDPETVVQITALVLAGAAYAGAWLAPRNAAT
ncbi:N-acetylmuramidase family protein [Aureimonas ureilytica]|uniref:N-acetylmuramidase family protein n=1 Tax=Aureimonas ureilytica TaxID=401562 RepID=UPI00036CCE35|nr:N-acetylmuramidase family protein [Aureimonas ureilytica]